MSCRDIQINGVNAVFTNRHRTEKKRCDQQLTWSSDDDEAESGDAVHWHICLHHYDYVTSVFAGADIINFVG